MGAIVIFGIIGFTIFRNVREKRQVAVKYGLRCPACGHTPPPHMVMDAALLERCAKCKSRLRQ